MEAPEKIYIPRLKGAKGFVPEWSVIKCKRYWTYIIEENVEYIRKDAIIDKACAWLKAQDDLLEWCGMTFQDDFTSRFRKYLEEITA